MKIFAVAWLLTFAFALPIVLRLEERKRETRWWFALRNITLVRPDLLELP